ncbi:MAG TPA: BamA/TamA family outer membrane protein, partial [Blastocatellia bacterium]|nr:BamA/TamA family outer membrane protein [Blastocatellia bacterium]
TRRLRLVPFYDLGNVFRNTKDIFRSSCAPRNVDARNLCADWTNTVGMGLRINTPIGPVGVDYGFLLDPPVFTTASGGLIRQPRGVIHIRFGQSF